MEIEKSEKNELSFDELCQRAEIAEKAKKFTIACNYWFIIFSKYLKPEQTQGKNYEDLIYRFLFGVILMPECKQKDRYVGFALENNFLKIFNYSNFYKKLLCHRMIYTDDYSKISKYCPVSQNSCDFAKAMYEHNLICLSKTFKNISFLSAEYLLKDKIAHIKNLLSVMGFQGKINVRIDDTKEMIFFEKEKSVSTVFDKQIQNFCINVKNLGEYIKNKEKI